MDASGSVSGASLYHNVIRKIFNKYFKSGDLIYIWGSSYRNLSENEFRTWNNNKNGELGGTASQLIADIVNDERNSGIEHLINFTDGGVDGDSIDKSDSKMKNYNIHFKYVSTYIIDSGGDRSVGAPYCRGDPNVTYLYINENNPEKLASLNHAELSLYNNFTSQITTYNHFISKADMLKNVIEAVMYGKERDNDLINKLNQLKSNIISHSLSSAESTDFNDKFSVLYQMANGALRTGGSLNFGAKKIN